MSLVCHHLPSSPPIRCLCWGPQSSCSTTRTPAAPNPAQDAPPAYISMPEPAAKGIKALLASPCQVIMPCISQLASSSPTRARSVCAQRGSQICGKEWRWLRHAGRPGEMGPGWCCGSPGYGFEAALGDVQGDNEQAHWCDGRGDSEQVGFDSVRPGLPLPALHTVWTFSKSL